MIGTCFARLAFSKFAAQLSSASRYPESSLSIEQRPTVMQPTEIRPTVTRCAIVTVAIDVCELLRSVQATRAGAATVFVGSVREFTNENGVSLQTERLTYDAYIPMAERTMQTILDDAVARYALVHAAAVHRIGELDLGDVAVAVAVSSPHRDAAFDAGREILERIKSTVPIWKQEHWSDGRSQWQHPERLSSGVLPIGGDTQ